MYPGIEKGKLYEFVKHADLSVVDGPFPLEATSHGSWRPSTDSLFVEEVRRKHGAIAIGPTPTIDLLVGDKRYFRKWCKRLNLPYSKGGIGEPWSFGAWFRERDIIPEGPYLAPWRPLFKSIRFRGWFELCGFIDESGVAVTHCRADWPPESIPEGKEVEFLRTLAK
jgi:hypothetical protein